MKAPWPKVRIQLRVKEKGLHIWRIEESYPAAIPTEDFGNFYTKDCYIIFESAGNEEDEKFNV